MITDLGPNQVELVLAPTVKPDDVFELPGKCLFINDVSHAAIVLESVDEELMVVTEKDSLMREMGIGRNYWHANT
jgi:hypothetical protein